MNFERLKRLIEHNIKKAKEEDNPLFLAEAEGMIKGVIALCETKGLLIKEERDYLTNTYNKINLLHLMMLSKLFTEDGKANE